MGPDAPRIADIDQNVQGAAAQVATAALAASSAQTTSSATSRLASTIMLITAVGTFLTGPPRLARRLRFTLRQRENRANPWHITGDKAPSPPNIRSSDIGLQMTLNGFTVRPGAAVLAPRVRVRPSESIVWRAKDAEADDLRVAARAFNTAIRRAESAI